MKEIESRGNETVKRYAALLEKKGRDREGLFLVEGQKMVLEGLSLAGTSGSVGGCGLSRKNVPCLPTVERLFVLRGCESEELFGAARKAGLDDEEICLLSESAFSKLSDTKNPQGVIGCFRKAERSIASLSCEGDVLVLDGISDPGNMGTLLRTAAACKIPVLGVGCADVYSPKCVRSTMSGIYFAEYYATDSREALEALRRNSLEICVADMGGKNFFEEKFAGPVAVVIGNEANGVSDFWRSAGGRILSLPMDSRIESLNAAVCGSVMMLHLKFSRKV